MSASDAKDLLQEVLPDGNIAIRGYVGYGPFVTVPGEIDGKRVTKINSGAFYNFDCIEQVVIEEGVEVIEDNAFTGCENLKSVALPGSVKIIEKNAFKDLYGIKKVYITSLADWLAVDFGNRESSPLRLRGDLCLQGEPIKKLIIPQDVTVIKQYAFYDSSIAEVVFPGGLKEICEDAFGFCENLKRIEIPDSVEKIAFGAFDFCNCVESIDVGQGNENYYSKDNCIIEKASQTLVLGCKNSIIPNEVKVIGELAFYGCKDLTGIVIPRGVREIGKMAFTFCKDLSSVFIPDTVEYVGDDAFNTNGKSIDVYIEDLTSWCKIKFISEYSNPLIYDGNLLLNGQSAANLTIPDGATCINNYAFSGCVNLKSIEIPYSVTEMGENAFFKFYNSTLYCHATSQPSTWKDGWSCGNTVVWGYKTNKA